MNLIVNGAGCDLVAGCIADIVEARLGDRRAPWIAVAVNDVVVRRSDWEGQGLKHGDRVDIVTAVQGG